MPDFQNPAAFFFLLLIPLLWLFRSLGLLQQPAFPVIFSDWKGDKFVWKKSGRAFVSLASRFFYLLSFVALVAAAANPVVHRQEKVYTSRGTDIVFVLDVSPSMAARDLGNTTRLETAVKALETLIAQNSGASFALVTMASEAAVLVPPTTDHELLLSRLEQVQVGQQGDGTALGTGLSTALYHLASSTAPRKCVVLVTDGENNAGEIHPLTAARLAKEYGITVYTLGIGTTGSVPLEYTDPLTGKLYSGYLESSFNQTQLREISEAAGGQFYTAASVHELEAALNAITRLQSVTQTFHLKNTEDYWYDEFAFLSLIFFAAAWLLQRLYLKERL